VLGDINLEVKRGEFITIVGQSGCGKSTLLRIIAGLVECSGGEVIRNGVRVTEPGTDCGMVFQDHRLLPWLRVKKNVGFGLRDMKKGERDELVKSHLKLVNLEGFENAWPHQLSGGMAQRAAIARGLVTNPDILLLDEPFGALDALTRIQLQKEILRIWREERRTMLLVTHDIEEAIFLGERVVVMTARPSVCEEVIDIPPDIGHDRGSAAFAQYKDRIYQHFFNNGGVQT
jgi:ABC-type nitrate/sulfonate/bicarbonate transport system ATPase subunit